MIKEGYRFVPMTELKKNKEKLTFIWEGKIAKNNTTVLAAPGDSGKSALVLYLMNRFAGEGWKVIMVDAESCTEQLIDRMEIWNLPHMDKVQIAVTKKQYKVDGEEETKDLVTGTTEEFEKMVDLIIDQKPDLVVIDSLTEIEHDLSNPKQVALIQKQFTKIQKRTGAAILLIAHTRKAMQGIKQKVSTDEVLGSLKVTTKPKSVLMISKDDENKNLRFIHTTKYNLAGPQPVCSFEFSSKGEVINFNENVKEEAPIKITISKADAIRERAIEYLESGITDWREISKMLKEDEDILASATECNRAKTQLKKAGVLTE